MWEGPRSDPPVSPLRQDHQQGSDQHHEALAVQEGSKERLSSLWDERWRIGIIKALRRIEKSTIELHITSNYVNFYRLMCSQNTPKRFDGP